MKFASALLGLTALGLSIVAADNPIVTYVDSPKAFRGALAFKDKTSGILFYVESDGRHVAAINSDGKILWNRDPFVESKLEPYRIERPVIVWIGEYSRPIQGVKGKFISISFNSSQFGILNYENGDFRFLGQD